MGKVAILIAVGLILLGAAGWVLFPEARTDVIQRISQLWSRSDQNVTLTYWGLWEPREIIQPLLDKYQQENPNITIEYEMRDPENHFETIDARLAGEGAPDIIRAHASWIPFLKDKLSSLPKEIMSINEYESIFYPVNQVFVKQEGKYFGIPLMIDGLALVYNKDLFLEEGIVNPPKTWNEFRDLSTRLTKTDSTGNLVQAGAALGHAKNIDYFADIIGLMFAQNGISFENKDGQVSFHQSRSPIGSNLAAEALSFYSLFATSEKSWSPQWLNSTQEFSAGKVAMIIIPSHRLHRILGTTPNFKIGVANAPQLPSVGGQSQSINWANYWVEVVAKTSPNAKQAWQFLKWMSEKEQLTEFYRLAGKLRDFGEPYPRSDMVSSLGTESYVLPYVQQGESYTTWYFVYGTFNSAIHDNINSVLSSMVENVAGGADPAGELNKVAEQVQQILTKAHSGSP